MAGKRTQKKKRKGSKRKKRGRSTGSMLPKLIGIALVVGALLVLGTYAYFSRDLPSVSTLRDYKPPQTTRVYDRNRKVIGEIFAERRTVIRGARLQRYPARGGSRHHCRARRAGRKHDHPASGQAGAPHA
jgi:membrane peptidoglycan carboxypeptidase